MLRSCDVQIRVRYAETDRMGLLHHAQYLVYFEQGRTELLRLQGISYRELEDAGYFLVVVEAKLKFRRPAYYDDLLSLRTILHRITPVRIEHRYELYRKEELLAEGETTLACVDRCGKLQPLPGVLRPAD
ncbi:MAG: thioesterase family protein [Gemmatales bacterium]|nr:acyl-CoA thioesterase [Gemmatales bacterium]MCS7160003.1 acyl-CoA thioesterase [Gemmatales bacterium]MDW8175202.1 thioesterase family protein [Gemmatales bacterium]MDW8222980.1 thioesterase family protein [Gemmatales bacterium]